MLQRVLLTGLISGALAGVLLTVVHLVMVQPLIAQAEVFENAAVASVQTPLMHRHDASLSHAHAGGGVAHTHDPAPVAHAHAGGLNHAHAGGALAHSHEDASQAQAASQAHEQELWEPGDGVERTLFTLLANLLVSIGYGLMLAAAWVMFGRPERVAHGLLWGAAGFLSFAFMPALGLPPELPGAVAGDLVARQSWWLMTAFGTAVGLGLCIFSGKWSMRVAGAVLILAPHLIGAPQADLGQAGNAPPELAAHFAMVTMFASAVLWAALGGIGAYVAARVDAMAGNPRVAPKTSA